MDEQVCFLIPIHPPHYKYLKFLEKLNNNNIFTIIFVLTYIEDKNSLIHYLNTNISSTFYNIKCITLEEDNNIANIISKFNSTGAGIINIKKLYGLNYLIHNYDIFDYIAVIDSEIEFINVDNLWNRFKLICDKKVAIAGNTTIRNNVHLFLDNIHNASLEYIKPEDRDIVNKITNNGKYYFWFSDIPVYDSKILPNFLTYIGLNNFTDFIKNMNFWTFDYVVYYYYCIAYHDYKILCMEDYDIKRHWSLESSPYEIYKQVCDRMDYKTSIVIGNCYYKNKDKFMKDGNLPIYVYHLNNPAYFNAYNTNIDYLDN